jgi:parvulin-like peptidyl-prolyl isomerase
VLGKEKSDEKADEEKVEDKLAASVKAAGVDKAGVDKAEEIHLSDVRRKLKDTFGSIERIRKDALPRFQALALGQLIDQALVLQSLERDKLGASPDEVKDELADIKKMLERDRSPTYTEYLKIKGHTEASLLRALAWEKSWKRHTARSITAEAIEQHFQKHHRELDGTEVRVGHILFKPADPAVPADIKKLVETAASVRSDLLADKSTFEAAVVAHSSGTKKDAGDLGFIRRQGSMPEPFAKAAFQLEKGQISPPVVSSFGVHLIRCTDERPGKKTLKDDDVVDQVKLRLARQLFEEIATRERNKALADPKNPGIKFTGQVPYLNPGTDELVLPKGL